MNALRNVTKFHAWSPVAEARINTGQQTSSTKYFLYSGTRSKAPGSPGRDPLCQFSFLTREVGLLDLQYGIQTTNVKEVCLLLCRDVFLIHSLLLKKRKTNQHRFLNFESS